VLIIPARFRKKEQNMTTFQHTGKATARQKFTSAFLLVLCVYVGIRGWVLLTAYSPVLFLALVTLALALLRGLDPFLSKPVLKIDETGISQSGRVWPGENWTLKWEAVTRARLYGGETPSLLVLSAKRATRLVADYEFFDQVIELTRAQLEKRGCKIEK
jgi:hypothetical protein